MKKVAVIQDLSSFGKCSLTAAIPVLSVMGVQAVPLPTAVLTAQTAYPSFFYEDFTSKMKYFIEEWSKQNETFDGIFTGFVIGQEQIENIFQFLDTFKTEKTILLVDPVMGDSGEVYKTFTDDLLLGMKDLVKQADVITPNITECCLLTGLSYEKLHNYSTEQDYIKAIEEAGQLLQEDSGAQVIITGVQPPPTNSNKPFIGNLFLNGNKAYYSSIPFNGKSYSGTGDLFASVIIGSLMRGDDLEKAVKLAENFLTEAIQDAAMEQVPEIEGVNFEKNLRMLI